MKRIYLSLLLFFGIFVSFGQTVIISEYVDACSGTTPKAIELWNPTAVNIDMSVTNIIIEIQTNANSAWTAVTTISSGTLEAGGVIVVSATTDVGINSSTCAIKQNTTLSHSGDDAFRVTLGSTVTDIFGDPSTIDPGAGWSGSGVVTAGGTLELNSGITTGEPAGWTDPSVRFQLVGSCAPSPTITGFGFPPGGCPVTGSPTILASPAAFSSLDYVFGSGPSAIDSVVISGALLTGAVTVTAITNFEFSEDKITWGTFPGTISGPVINVTPIKVYVRLAASLAVNTYSETLTLSSASAADVNVSFSGEVTAVPVVCTPSLQSLPYAGISGSAGFDHNTANPPAAAPAEVCGSNFLLSYTATPGTDLSANEFGNQSNLGLIGLSSADFGGEASFESYPIDVSAVTGVNIDAVGATNGAGTFNSSNEGFAWWYSLDGGVTIDTFFQTTLDGSLAASVANLDVTGINEIIVGFIFEVNGTGAGFQGMDVAVTAYVPNLPTINVGSTSMTGFSYIAGSGPSTSQANSLDWADLTGNITSGGTVNSFEFSIDTGATWNNASILNVLIPPSPVTSVGAVPILVRLKSLLTAGTYFDTVVLASSEATTVEIYLEGTVNPAPLVNCTELFFSEYIEGNSYNKCLEIYNPTAMDIDLAAGSYAIAIYGNGSTVPNGGVPTPLAGVIPAYGTYVICNSSSAPGFQALADSVGGVYNSLTLYNGDDAVALEKAGVNVDIIGQIGVDPGSAWSNAGVSTANMTLVRIASVGAGDNIGGDAFDPSVEWISLGIDDFSNLGQQNSFCAPFVWTGITSTDYHAATNWTKATVPTSTDDAWIPTSPIGGVFPIAGADVDLTNLTVRTNASMNMAPTFGLSFSGTVANNGTLTLESSAAGTAWLDDFTNAATYTGDITVQTFVSTGSGLGQRYFGSAVSGSAVQGLDGTYTGYPLGQIVPLGCDPNQLDAASPYSNLFEWNENNTFATSCVQEGWTAISAGTTLIPGRAYSGWVNDGAIISVEGTPNTGNVVFNTTGTSASSAAVPNANGWHLLANPFPSALNVNSVFTSGFVSPQTYDGGSGPYSGTFNSVLITGNNLAVMQGFVAKSNVGATFTAAQADRVSGNEIWLRPEFTHMLEVNVEGNNMADKTYVYFDSEATDGFDNIADCEKRESDFGHPTLYTNLNGQRMSLNGYAIDNMNKSVGLGLLPGTNGAYTMNFDGITSFPATSLIFLEDKLTGDFVNLREQTTYAFTANTAAMADRFEIHFTAPITLTTFDASCEGGDAEISIDFGTNTVNNTAVEWDYNVEANNATLTSGTNMNGIVTLVGMQVGVYTLVLNQGAYVVDLPITINGALKITAEFENPTSIEQGNTIALANMSNGAVDYTWTVEGQSFNAVDFIHTFNNPGTFDIILDASNEDCQERKVKTIEVAAKVTAIQNAVDLASAYVYTQNSTIVVDLSKLKLPTASSIEIYNLLGQSIYSNEVGNTIVKIDMKNTSAYYFVTLRNKDLQKVFKVLVK